MALYYSLIIPLASLTGFLPGIVGALNHSLVTVNIAYRLMNLGLSSFNTLVINHRFSFDNLLAACNIALVNVAINCC
jgi:hypothetical protein